MNSTNPTWNEFNDALIAWEKMNDALARGESVSAPDHEALRKKVIRLYHEMGQSISRKEVA